VELTALQPAQFLVVEIFNCVEIDFLALMLPPNILIMEIVALPTIGVIIIGIRARSASGILIPMEPLQEILYGGMPPAGDPHPVVLFRATL
jgi:hypothetical protein